VLIADVTPNGPAAKSGLKGGDLILSFDGKPIHDSRELPRIVADTQIGKTVNVDYWRHGKKDTLHMTVAKLQDEPKVAAQKNAPSPPVKGKSKIAQLGLSLALLDADAREHYKIDNSVQGVVVTDVDPDSVAADRNIRPGDVIVEVQSQAVRSPNDVTKKIDADAKAGRKVEMILINRGGDSTFVALRLSGG